AKAQSPVQAGPQQTGKRVPQLSPDSPCSQPQDKTNPRRFCDDVTRTHSKKKPFTGPSKTKVLSVLTGSHHGLLLIGSGPCDTVHFLSTV
ncbi:hypothetical protein U0070_020947, partial [Myodes glareolus]